MKKGLGFIIALLAFTAACNNNKKEEAPAETGPAIPIPAPMSYSVVKVYPHDTTSFTEGLIWLNDQLYESTGLENHSKLLRADLKTGKANKEIHLPGEYFGEGISVLNNRIYQLTYKEHKVFVYDMDFKKTGEFEWPYEGWGMTTDGKNLLVNTGGSNIYFVDPATFKIVRTLGVVDNNGYVDSINEMEYLDGYVYANKYMTNYILKINLQTGYVEKKADLTGILEKNNVTIPSTLDVLNGIAYDSAKGSFYVTGKYYPAVLEVKFN